MRGCGRDRSIVRQWGSFSLLFGICALAFGSADAAPQTDSRAERRAESTRMRSSAGHRVAVGPGSEREPPNDPSALALNERLRAMLGAGSYRTRVLESDETRLVSLGGTYLSLSVIRLHPDGTREGACGLDFDSGQRFLAEAATAAPTSGCRGEESP